MTHKACVFDAYGTLFDVAAAARALAARSETPALAGCWPALAEDWRQKQLQYTWLRAITDEYDSFWQLTEDALDWALERHGLAGDPPLRADLLALYARLETYPEVPAALAALRPTGLPLAILSNGAPEMLDSAVQHAGLGGVFDAVLSADTPRTFKPMDAVYALVTERYACAPHEILFMSSNGWDVAGASGFGFETVWINRKGEPQDRLPHGPAHVLTDLTSLPELVS
ncbi:haloacid dehalogenase type II [Poseidonocella sedimentorum]|uniref:(S)-2-haloacid dehalogenase n=1 Tax=Poseidonocella sedimentorum TaxID=871652 RepID=A0A1I6E7Q6_9RHOB|nr:haloacid dehalogenase type II [Poseidonocella sedimentorum]SFR13754.1 2-haloacid dehalogenase [Poseidonocella sedimentorum]